jgi:hypothetical protein
MMAVDRRQAKAKLKRAPGAPMFCCTAMLLAAFTVGPGLSQVTDRQGGDGSSGAPAAKLPSCKSEIGNILGERSYSLPRVGEVHEADIGGVILTAATVNVAEEGIRLLEPVSFEGRAFVDIYVATFPPGEYRHSEFAASMSAPNASYRYKGERNDRQGIRRPDMFILFERNNLDVVKAMVSSAVTIKSAPIAPRQYELLMCERTATKAFRREILYSGAPKARSSFSIANLPMTMHALLSRKI